MAGNRKTFDIRRDSGTGQFIPVETSEEAAEHYHGGAGSEARVRGYEGRAAEKK